ncbi:hypothetical protein [Clostridium minihomine]|uniref:hypothetical protein n=1 Tax=Clostridium minihomine TaxID=2045012 RepID=UPI000C75C6E5|nr:hypothetical protein [Clostridium minihomine]
MLSYSDLEAEVNRLVQKCNKQLDYIKDQQKKASQMEEEIKQLQNDCKKDCLTQNDKLNNFIIFSEIFYHAISKALKENSFFESKRVTENSKRYNVIDYRVLAGYIEDFITVYPLKQVIKVWAAMGLIYQDEYENAFVNFTHKGKSVRSIRVKKDAVDLVKESMP